ncbi:MAG: hypothetical protein GXY44_08475 [Phycisphaerales bacterium]|nr:hypothetical protein [Phycisphaerales bacterium]
MSLQEFLVFERETRQNAEMPPATTQPIALPPEVVENINKELGPYRVGHSDVLIVTLTVGDELAPTKSMVARVNRDGDVELPLAGNIQVLGLELEDAEQAIRDAYVPKIYQEAVIHVELSSFDQTNIMVIGAVQMPGLVALRHTERNLMFALASAGGASEAASGSVTLRRLRRPWEEVTMNLRNPEQLRAALTLDHLEDGDIVYVEPATPNTVFVGGLVNAPRPQIYPPGVKVNVLQAIAASGGLRTDITPREATLIRQLPDGRDIQVKLDMDRVSAGKDPNITLAAGDILWIPHTVETRIQDWINRNIFVRAGVSATAGYNANYNAYGVKYLNDTAEQQYDRYSSPSSTLQDRFDPFSWLVPQPVTPTVPTGP